MLTDKKISHNDMITHTHTQIHLWLIQEEVKGNATFNKRSAGTIWGSGVGDTKHMSFWY